MVKKPPYSHLRMIDYLSLGIVLKGTEFLDFMSNQNGGGYAAFTL